MIFTVEKKVLVTGHTGFKGTWLTTWLLELGADVCGISLDIPTSPSMFEELKLKDKVAHHVLDVRDRSSLEQVITEYRPDFFISSCCSTYCFHVLQRPSRYNFHECNGDG